MILANSRPDGNDNLGRAQETRIQLKHHAGEGEPLALPFPIGRTSTAVFEAVL
jgi:hypothetical protein